MNVTKFLLSAAALALLATPAFATSSSIDTAASAEETPDVTAAPEPAPSMDASPASEIPADPSPATEATAPTIDTPTPSEDTATAPSTEPAPSESAAAPSEPAPAAEEAKPAPVVKKKSAPAKLSALAKKYDLMSLDTDGNKSISRDEFVAGGFGNAKTFSRFDADGNGRLSNSEINAYASVIEANSKK